MDFRYTANYNKISPFIYETNGILLNSENLKSGTKVFINPGIGVKIKISKRLSFTFGSGLFFQVGGDMEEITYNNIFTSVKAGLVYKPR